jgi:predicted Fe-Mo cluster-binding NifX family protein
MRIAIPSKGDRGMRDEVSDVFARAAYFTIIDLQNGDVENIMVEENIASSLKHGAGPMVVKMLKEKGVDAILTGELGPGAKTLLELSEIRAIRVAPGIKVRDAIVFARAGDLSIGQGFHLNSLENR